MKRKYTEIKLLTIRQRLLSALKSLRKRSVVPFEYYTNIRVQLEVCNEMIKLYREQENLNGKNNQNTQVNH